VCKVLNRIYEADFMGFSYGFRPGRSQHQALDALWVGLMERKVNWVLDADIKGYFDNIDHEWLMKFVEHRVADPRMLRLIQKWLRAGVSEEGEWSKTTVGTPQGAVISPLLANVYLHYAFDLWVEKWRKEKAKGDVIVVRYADDFIVGFEHKQEAEAFLAELRERLEKFGLTLHPEKTRLIEFGLRAARDRKARGEGKPETFDFLGFTHYCGKTRQNRRPYIWRKTVKKRLRAKVQAIKQELKRRMHDPIVETGKWLCGVIRGYDNYHAVPGNRDALRSMRQRIKRDWHETLRRRGEKHRITWAKFQNIVDRWIPAPRILHPYPNQRFYANRPKVGAV
jgi:RNA-directed DNA polymerase